MAHIPIRQLTLYKQGIGYFRRAGAMTGTQMVLVIPRTGTNDALKSLNVEIHAGGPLLSVDYETPEDTGKKERIKKALTKFKKRRPAYRCKERY